MTFRPLRQQARVMNVWESGGQGRFGRGEIQPTLKASLSIYSMILFQKYWSRDGRPMPPRKTPEQEAAELVRGTQDARVVRARAMADAHHFDWLKEQLLTVPDDTPFDVMDPIRSYAQLFNRTAFPAGLESRIEHVLAEARRDVLVIPGIEHGTRRWKLQCLAVSTDWMDPHLEVAFPRLGEAIRLIHQLVGKRGVAFTDVQLVTFTEWRRPQPKHYGLQDRIEALADKLSRAGVTFEVLTWDCNRFDWSPDLNEIGQPLMRHGTRPCHWRLDRWSDT